MQVDGEAVGEAPRIGYGTSMSMIPMSRLQCPGRVGSWDFHVPDTPEVRAVAAKPWKRHKRPDRCALIGQVALVVGSTGRNIRILPHLGLVAFRDLPLLPDLPGSGHAPAYAAVIPWDCRMVCKTKCVLISDAVEAFRAASPGGAFCTWFVETFDAGGMRPGVAVTTVQPPAPKSRKPKILPARRFLDSLRPVASTPPVGLSTAPVVRPPAGIDGLLSVSRKADDPFVDVRLAGLDLAVIDVRGLDADSLDGWAAFARTLCGSRSAEVRLSIDRPDHSFGHVEAI